MGQAFLVISTSGILSYIYSEFVRKSYDILRYFFLTLFILAYQRNMLFVAWPNALDHYTILNSLFYLQLRRTVSHNSTKLRWCRHTLLLDPLHTEKKQPNSKTMLRLPNQAYNLKDTLMHTYMPPTMILFRSFLDMFVLSWVYEQY